MRKLIAGFAISLDGFIEGPNGEYDWIIYDKEQYKELAEYWKKIDTLFYGRKTYEAVLKMKDNSKEKNSPFAHMKHYVFSNGLSEVEKGFILINGDTNSQVIKIKNEPGKNIAGFGCLPRITWKGKTIFQQYQRTELFYIERMQNFFFRSCVINL
jgi:dihydrofolate reductase